MQDLCIVSMLSCAITGVATIIDFAFCDLTSATAAIHIHNTITPFRLRPLLFGVKSASIRRCLGGWVVTFHCHACGNAIVHNDYAPVFQSHRPTTPTQQRLTSHHTPHTQRTCLGHNTIQHKTKRNASSNLSVFCSLLLFSAGLNDVFVWNA
jgi:hypothetical protein